MAHLIGIGSSGARVVELATFLLKSTGSLGNLQSVHIFETNESVREDVRSRIQSYGVANVKAPNLTFNPNNFGRYTGGITTTTAGAGNRRAIGYAVFQQNQGNITGGFRGFGAGDRVIVVGTGAGGTASGMLPPVVNEIKGRGVGSIFTIFLLPSTKISSAIRKANALITLRDMEAVMEGHVLILMMPVKTTGGDKGGDWILDGGGANVDLESLNYRALIESAGIVAYEAVSATAIAAGVYYPEISSYSITLTQFASEKKGYEVLKKSLEDILKDYTDRVYYGTEHKELEEEVERLENEVSVNDIEELNNINEKALTVVKNFLGRVRETQAESYIPYLRKLFDENESFMKSLDSYSEKIALADRYKVDAVLRDYYKIIADNNKRYRECNLQLVYHKVIEILRKNQLENLKDDFENALLSVKPVTPFELVEAGKLDFVTFVIPVAGVQSSVSDLRSRIIENSENILFNPERSKRIKAIESVFSNFIGNHANGGNGGNNGNNNNAGAGGGAGGGGAVNNAVFLEIEAGGIGGNTKFGNITLHQITNTKHIGLFNDQRVLSEIVSPSTYNLLRYPEYPFLNDRFKNELWNYFGNKGAVSVKGGVKTLNVNTLLGNDIELLPSYPEVVGNIKYLPLKDVPDIEIAIQYPDGTNVSDLVRVSTHEVLLWKWGKDKRIF